MKKIILVSLIILANLNIAQAKDVKAASDDKYSSYKNTQLDLSETAKMEIAPDLYNAVLHFETSGYQDVAELQNIVNEKMIKAKNITMTYTELKVDTKDYNSSREYTGADSSKNPKWKISQTIEIDTKNKADLINVVAKLQGEGFMIDSMNAYISDAKKASYKNKLIDEALSLIKNRAQVVANSIGKKTVKFSQVTINSNGDSQPYYGNSMMKMSASSDARIVSEPVLESSTQEISVTLSAKLIIM